MYVCVFVTVMDEFVMIAFQAEVQQTYHDGSLSLHTRNLRYGKVHHLPLPIASLLNPRSLAFQLSQGLLMKVCPYLVRRRKTHFHNLPCGAALILGCNGYVWISPIGSEDESLSGGYVQNLDQVVSLALPLTFFGCRSWRWRVAR